VATILLRVAGGIWLAALQIAAPILIATVLCDIALGFLGKASPQMPVLFVGLSIKSMLGLLVLVGTLGLWPQLLEARFQSAVALGQRMLHLAS
jgi:flagellar biosynthetic protein FliR